MHPRLFDIPIYDGPQVSWAVFIVLIALVAVPMTAGTAVAEKRKLLGQLLTTLPLAGFLAAFVVFVKTPFGRMPINSYGFAIMVGFLLAAWIAVRRAKPEGIKSDFILDVGIISMIFGIIGAKINFLLQYPEDVAEPGKLSIWGDSALNPWGVLLGMAPLAFWWWRVGSKGERVKLYSWQNGVLILLTLVFAVVGTRGLHLYLHQEEYSWKVIKGWQSGFVLYGGLMAGIAAGVVYTKMRSVSVSYMADLAAGPMMLAVAFGRLGCFLNGCCYGKRGDGFPCISFPDGSPPFAEQQKSHVLDFAAKSSLPVHPTQLYEAAACVGMFFLLSWLWKRPRKAKGEVFLAMIMLYATWRFLIEFVRDDLRPRIIGDLSYSQVVGIVAFVIAAVLLRALRRRAEEPTVPPAPQAPVAGDSAL